MKYNIRWIILAIVILASFVAYVLRTNVSIVTAVMGKDLGLTEIHIGLIFSAFAAGYAIFQFPGGVLGAKYGPRLIIALLAVAWGILTLLTAIVPGTDMASVFTIVAMLMVVRFLVGATHAPFFPCVGGSVIANWFPAGGWGLPNGLSSTGLTLGAAATAPFIVWLMESYGWREAIAMTAPFAFVVAALWWWYVRDYPKEHSSVTPRERELIDKNRTFSEKAQKGAWKQVLLNREILLLTGSYFCMNYVFYLFFNWFFYFLTEVKGFSVTEAGFLTASLWVIGAVGATVGGFACDISIRRLGYRMGPRIICFVSLSLCGVLLFAGAVSESPYLAVTLFCLCFGLTQITEAAFWSTSISVAGRYASAAGGVMNTGGNVVGFIGGTLVPVTAASFGWTAAIATGSIFAIIGAVLWLFIRGDEEMVVPSESSKAA